MNESFYYIFSLKCDIFCYIASVVYPFIFDNCKVSYIGKMSCYFPKPSLKYLDTEKKSSILKHF